ncbi:hypothetical protein GCM10022252_41410 [Streptosporangium oxazolinicum]|uniref:Secreted protein n=1 Tax=Streptosporangium oxazolinicum TaxID=909287 RepID=A0ABP8B0Z7_9ACTN
MFLCQVTTPFLSLARTCPFTVKVLAGKATLLDTTALRADAAGAVTPMETSTVPAASATANVLFTDFLQRVHVSDPVRRAPPAALHRGTSRIDTLQGIMFRVIRCGVPPKSSRYS